MTATNGAAPTSSSDALEEPESAAEAVEDPVQETDEGDLDNFIELTFTSHSCNMSN